MGRIKLRMDFKLVIILRCLITLIREVKKIIEVINFIVFKIGRLISYFFAMEGIPINNEVLKS